MKKIEIACIIDDDPIFIFGAKKLMELIGFCNSFLIFNNGTEALDRLKAIIERNENVPDIILLDINMPVMDGWEFLDEFVKIAPQKDIHIYIMTSSIDSADIEKAKHYDSIFNYIIKPVTIDSLRKILTNFQS